MGHAFAIVLIDLSILRILFSYVLLSIVDAVPIIPIRLAPYFDDASTPDDKTSKIGRLNFFFNKDVE